MAAVEGVGRRARLPRHDDAADRRARARARGSSRSSRTRRARAPTTAGSWATACASAGGPSTRRSCADGATSSSSAPGSAGLAAARDLAAGGADVERARGARPRRRARRAARARRRPGAAARRRGGGRVPHRLPRAGRPSSGWRPSRPTSPSRARLSWWLPEGAGQGDFPPGFTAADVARPRSGSRPRCVALARTVDPDDPWAHPDAAALDAVSVAGWMREQGATPAVLRMHELSALSMAGGSEERRSLLGVLRQVAVAGAEELYGDERWEGHAARHRQRLARAARWARSSATASGSARW